MDEAGDFHKASSFDDGYIIEIFDREVLSFLAGKEFLGPERGKRFLSRQPKGFSVLSRVGVRTKTWAEQVACLSAAERQGQFELSIHYSWISVLKAFCVRSKSPFAPSS